MLTIEIKINGKLIHEIKAVNVSEKEGLKYGKGEQIYEVESSSHGITSRVKHIFEDGALKLAQKLIWKLDYIIKKLEIKQKKSEANV